MGFISKGYKNQITSSKIKYRTIYKIHKNKLGGVIMLQLKVKVNYPTDPEILDQLDTRAAKALATAYANTLPPKKFDELITKLRAELNA